MQHSKYKQQLFIIMLAPLITAGCIALNAPEPTAGEFGSKQAKITNPDICLDEFQIPQDTSSQRENSVGINQITSKPEGTDFGFSDIEGDDPCLQNRAAIAPEYCKDTANILQPSPQDNAPKPSALSELQSIVPEIIDPDTFDPERTADELGRKSTSLNTQAGMALGAELLAPPKPPRPEPTENKSVHPKMPDSYPHMEHPTN